MDVIGHLLRRAGFGASGNDVKYETDFAPSTRASSTTGSAAIRWRSSAGTSGALVSRSFEDFLGGEHLFLRALDGGFRFLDRRFALLFVRGAPLFFSRLARVLTLLLEGDHLRVASSRARKGRATRRR